MILKQLHIENIRNYRNIHISFNEGITVVKGKMGSGKSTIFEALSLAFFGKTTSISGTPFIRFGTKCAFVSLKFELNSQIYEIQREFGWDNEKIIPVNVESSLHINGKMHSNGNMHTNEAILSLINIDEKLYDNWVYVRFSESNEDRRSMIRSLLRSDEIGNEGHIKNIDALNLHLNEIFSKLNLGDTSLCLQLDPDYNLLLYEKDEDPYALERVRKADTVNINFILRIALSRLLSTNTKRNSYRPALPPLIADDILGSLHLDQMGKIVKLIDLMKEIYEGQVMIVIPLDPYDKQFINSADHTLEVLFDETTESSHPSANTQRAAGPGLVE